MSDEAVRERPSESEDVPVSRQQGTRKTMTSTVHFITGVLGAVGIQHHGQQQGS